MKTQKIVSNFKFNQIISLNHLGEPKLTTHCSVVYVPADLCTLEDILIEEEKLEKATTRPKEKEQVYIEKIKDVKSHEENVKILEDAIHDSLGNTVKKCDELLDVVTPQIQESYVKRMLQSPTKAERLRYSGQDANISNTGVPTLF